MINLCIETSCDNTCIAVLNNKKILLQKNVCNYKIYEVYKGIHPKIASDQHFYCIHNLLQTSLKELNLQLKEIDNILVTYGPGLLTSLSVGYYYALGLSLKYNINLISINHLFAHIGSIFDSNYKKKLQFPLLAFIFSGGHSIGFLLENKNSSLKLVISTLDDALGELYDKVGRLLGFSFPYGVFIDEFSQQFLKKNKNEFFNVKLPKIKVSDSCFSFSGIKTFMKNFINKQAIIDVSFQVKTSFSFQKQIIDYVLSKILILKKKYAVQDVIITGGVISNSYFRILSLKEKFLIPQLEFSTDNAVMLGFSFLSPLKKIFLKTQLGFKTTPQVIFSKLVTSFKKI